MESEVMLERNAVEGIAGENVVIAVEHQSLLLQEQRENEGKDAKKDVDVTELMW